MDWKLPLFKMYWENDDVEAVCAAIKKGMFWAIGPEIAEFEKVMADYHGRKHAVAFNSGTSALHALMAAYGFGKNDEIIVPSFSFIATANSPLFVGAKPAFADIENKTYALSAKDVEKRITKNTKAIMPIHYGGSPAIEIAELGEIAAKHGIKLIEDNAEGLGTTLNGKKAGSFGESAILSFCSNKVISTGEGGMVICDSEELYHKLLLLRSHGREEGGKNFFSTNAAMDYVSIGYNMRMPTMCAALGITQMKKLEKIIAMRRQNAKRLDEGIGKIAGISTPYSPKEIGHAYQMYTIRFKDNKTREKAKEALAKAGIMGKVYFEPIHKTHFYKNVLGYNITLPATEKASQEVLSLPIYTKMGDDEINSIISALRGAM